MRFAGALGGSIYGFDAPPWDKDRGEQRTRYVDFVREQVVVAAVAAAGAAASALGASKREKGLNV
jgi:hypothetical protein